jgi:hypothetical protein
VSFNPVPPPDKRFNGIHKRVGIAEVSITENATAHDREPQLDLVEPGTMRWCVVKDKPISMPSIPVRDEIAPARILVGIQIVQNHVDTTLAIGGRHHVHELQEIHSRSGLCTASQYFPGAHVKARKQATSAIPPIFEVESGVLATLGRLQWTAS